MISARPPNTPMVVNWFIAIAPSGAPWSSACTARSEPHSGHSQPVNARNGHDGNHHVAAGSNANSSGAVTSAMHNEVRWIRWKDISARSVAIIVAATGLLSGLRAAVVSQFNVNPGVCAAETGGTDVDRGRSCRPGPFEPGCCGGSKGPALPDT